MRSYTSRTVQKEQKLPNRVRRIRGQLDTIECALGDEHGCISVLQQITSCRGIMSSLLVGMPEDHIRAHLIKVDAEHEHTNDSAKSQLVEVVYSYFK